MSTTPRPAATVVLVRPNPGPEPFQVLLTQRATELRFFGGYCAFPGGALEPGDRERGLLERCHGVSPSEAARVLGLPESEGEFALAHWVAAQREAFEEVGILIAAEREGRPVTPDHLPGAAAARAALREGRIRFGEWLASEGLVLRCDRLRPFFHLVTPAMFPRRFDTHFFLARMPVESAPEPFPGEVSRTYWLTPGEALARAEEGAIQLPPPTAYALRQLAGVRWESLWP